MNNLTYKSSFYSNILCHFNLLHRLHSANRKLQNELHYLIVDSNSFFCVDK